VTGLSSLHPDGSLRAVLVQFRAASLGSTQTLAGRIDVGAARPSAMTLATALVTPGAAVANTPKGLPQAAALPTDPNYLIATDLVGATIPVAATNALGGNFARYESDWAKYSTLYWGSEGSSWSGNYYDRALIYYAWWARTGNPTYWMRASRQAADYRVSYLEANAYNSSPHWSQLEGLEKHYLLTGDDASRQAVGRTAGRLIGFINSSYLTRSMGEGRIAARVLHAQLLGWRLTAGGTAIAGYTQTAYGANVEATIGKLVAWQQANGSFPADGQVCGGQLNYMIGQQNDALIKTFEQYVPATTSRATLQTTIRSLVTKSVDYLWSTQWVATKNAFQYTSVNCSGIGSTTPAPDLNNMISASFAWVYDQTGNTAYLTKADAIFAGGVTQAYLNGSKQFNENYTSSFRYLGYR
jgi:hypothetical protein